MNNIDSLYELIKNKKEEKGRKLKIICDWDDCIFSTRATATYGFYNNSKTFEDFFEDFWENVSVSHKDKNNLSANKIFTYNGTGEIKEAHKKFRKLEEERKTDPNKNDPKYKPLNVVDNQPFLSFAETLLAALKEDLIGKIIIISASYSGKKGKPSTTIASKNKRFANTFGKFPQCSLNIHLIERVDGQNKPHRWEWIKDNHPDFDIFIDDDKSWIKSVRSHFGDDKIHVINDYKYSRDLQADNIYHVKTTVSDLKDSDFSLAALEKNLEKLEREIKEEITVKNPVPFWRILSGLFFCSLVLIIIVVIARVDKKEKNIRYVAKKRK